MENKKKILVTGVAQFIGFHLSKRLVDLGHLSGDFIYIDDLVNVALSSLGKDSINNDAYWFDSIENNSPIELLGFT